MKAIKVSGFLRVGVAFVSACSSIVLVACRDGSNKSTVPSASQNSPLPSVTVTSSAMLATAATAAASGSASAATTGSATAAPSGVTTSVSDEEDALPPRAAAGTTVVPHIDAHASSEDGPIFRVTGLPAYNEEKNLVAYFDVDREPVHSANQQVLLIDATTGKTKKSVMLAKADEWVSLPEKTQNERAHWASRAVKANQIFEGLTWKALAFAEGAEVDEDDYQPPTKVAGFTIGFDKGAPRTLRVRAADATVVHEMNIASWYPGKSTVLLDDVSVGPDFALFLTLDFEQSSERKVRHVRFKLSKKPDQATTAPVANPKTK
jgi:hypothetical protein